jgi:hypothetical protein
VKKTWFHDAYAGDYFRSSGLVLADRKRLVNRVLFWRQAALEKEWREIFRAGVTRVSAPPATDRVLPFDGSPAAVNRWAKRFTASNGRDTR